LIPLAAAPLRGHLPLPTSDFLDLAATFPGNSLLVDASASVRDVSRRCLEKMQALAEAKLGAGTPERAVFLGTDR